MMFLVLRFIYLGYARPRVAAPKASGCPPQRGGTREILGAVQEDFWEETKKQKTQSPSACSEQAAGRRNYPEAMPMERVGTETMHRNVFPWW
jgi:hypothetical protein